MGSCYLCDYNPFLLEQDGFCVLEHLTSSHSTLTLAFRTSAHFPFLDCAVLSHSTGLFWAIPQLLMLLFMVLASPPFSSPSSSITSLGSLCWLLPRPLCNTSLGDQVLCHLLAENIVPFLQNTYPNLQLYIYLIVSTSCCNYRCHDSRGYILVPMILPQCLVLAH